MEKEDLITALKSEVLSWPELREMARNEAEEIIKSRDYHEGVTYKQFAKIWNVSEGTAKTLNAEELRGMGYEKVYVASLPRLRKIEEVEPSRENFKLARKQR